MSDTEKKLSRKDRKALRKKKREEEKERRKKEKESGVTSKPHTVSLNSATKTKWGEHNAKEPTITCGLVCSDNPTVYFDVEAVQKIEAMMEEYPHSEWLGYLVGYETQRHNFIVDDLVIPPHKDVSTGGVEVETGHHPQNCVGVIHSHHSMGAFHSTTDDDHVDRNYPISVTVAGDSEDLGFDIVSIRKTPCGRISSVKCKEAFLDPPLQFNKEEWMKEAKANVAKGENVHTGFQYYDPYTQAFRYYGRDQNGVHSQDAPPYRPDGKGVNHRFPPDHWRNKLAANMAAAQGRKIIPVKNTTAIQSPLRTVSAEEVTRVQNRLKALFDIDLTRSEIEDMILRSPVNTNWDELGDRS